MIFVESLFNMPFSTMATVLMCWVHAPLIFCTKYTTFTIFHLPMWLYQRTRHQASACVWRESIPETSRSSPSSPQVSPQWTSLKSSQIHELPKWRSMIFFLCSRNGWSFSNVFSFCCFWISSLGSLRFCWKNMGTCASRAKSVSNKYLCFLG